MTDSQNSTSKCFSGVLRRLLCTGSLPTHPSDLITEPTDIPTTFDHPKTDFKKIEIKTPNLVARLMGLDSLPDLNWSAKDLILRSRSVNSVDYLPEFDLTPARHRRVRTSVSFREIPTFLQQQQQQQQKQNHDFFVLCFEKVGSEMGLEELKQREVGRERNRENLRERKFDKKKENQEKKKNFSRKMEVPNRVCGNCSSKVDNVNLARKNKVVVQRQPRESLRAKSVVQNQKETGNESKFGNKKTSRNKAKKVDSVCVSENLSPVSVLDLHNSFHETTSTGDSKVKILNSRSSNVPNNDNPSSNCTRNFIADEHHVVKAKKNRRDDDKAEKTSESEYYEQLLSEILRLTEEGMKETDWVAEKVMIEFEDVEEICTLFGQQILDLLLHQVVEELCPM